jgi:hypothetical protein
MLGSVGGLLIGKGIDLASGKSTTAQSAVAPETERLAVVDEPTVESLLASFERAFAEVDLVVEAVQPRPVEVPAMDPQVLELIHGLMESFLITSDQRFLRVMRERQNQVATLLMQKGIEPVLFEDVTDPERRTEFFDLELSANPDLTEPSTESPALASAGRVLRKGRVMMPRTNQ